MASVDVIIPSYNAAKFLSSALESVIAQTFQDWQILLVDDGSTDNTLEVVAPYIERCGSKLRYIKQANGGLPAARNAAIRASASEFIALLDADDVWLPCRLAESVKAMKERADVGLSYGDIGIIDSEDRVSGAGVPNKDHAEGHIAPYIYMRTVELPCPTIMFRRRCIDEVGMFDETMRATEDRDLWLRIALRYEVAYIPRVLAYYRRSPNSMSADGRRMLNAQLQFIRKHYGSTGCGIVRRQMAFARCYKQYADNLKTRGNAAAAVRSSLYSLMLFPFAMDSYRTAISLLANWISSPSRPSRLQ